MADIYIRHFCRWCCLATLFCFQCAADAAAPFASRRTAFHALAVNGDNEAAMECRSPPSLYRSETNDKTYNTHTQLGCCLCNFRFRNFIFIFEKRWKVYAYWLRRVPSPSGGTQCLPIAICLWYCECSACNTRAYQSQSNRMAVGEEKRRKHHVLSHYTLHVLWIYFSG